MSHPLHPLIAGLLGAIEHPKDGESHVPATMLKNVEAALRREPEKEAFFDLLASWHRLHLAKIQPAASQLLALVRLYPQVRHVKNEKDMAALAKKTMKADVQTRDRMFSMQAPTATNSVGMRKK